MPADFRYFENALREFLAEEQEDNYRTRMSIMNKYHNLKISMDPKRLDDPHFIIAIGISESTYDLITGKKLAGGLGSDERLVRKWIERNLHKFQLGNLWIEAKKVREIRIKKDHVEEGDE